jgi:hypothetical protein
LLLTASSAASSSVFENRRSKVISTGRNSRRGWASPTRRRKRRCKTPC